MFKSFVGALPCNVIQLRPKMWQHFAARIVAFTTSVSPMRVCVCVSRCVSVCAGCWPGQCKQRKKSLHIVHFVRQSNKWMWLQCVRVCVCPVPCWAPTGPKPSEQHSKHSLPPSRSLSASLALCHCLAIMQRVLIMTTATAARREEAQRQRRRRRWRRRWRQRQKATSNENERMQPCGFYS